MTIQRPILLLLVVLLFAPKLLAISTGLEAEKVGEWKKAIQFYERELSRNPKQADLAKRIAELWAEHGKSAEAANAYARFAQIKKNDPEAHFQASQAYSVANLPRFALRSIDEAVQLDPENVKYLKARAQLANWAGETETAVKSYERLHEISKEDDDLLQLARTSSWVGELDESVAHYREYLKAHPNEKAVWLEYSKVESWRGNYPVSFELLNQYQEKFGQDEESIRLKSRVLAWAGKPGEAQEILGPILRKEPNDYDLNYTDAIANYRGRRPRTAFQRIEKLETLKPNSPDTKEIRLALKNDHRSNATAGARYSIDSDELGIFHMFLQGAYEYQPETQFEAGFDTDYLRADLGSGLETLSGDRDATHYQGWIGVRHRFNSYVMANVNLGASHAEGETGVPTYGAGIEVQPRDDFMLRLTRQYGFYVISPRAVSSDVKRGANTLLFQWDPTLRYTILGSGSYDDFSDDNGRWEALLAPRRSIFRTEHFNLDLGVRGWWFGFQDDLNNGYYDPNFYQSYMGTTFLYWKIAKNHGLGLYGGAGAQKDEAIDDFRFGWTVDVEGTFGIYGDWTLKPRAAYLQNLREASGAYKGFLGQLTLTRRF